MWNEDERNEADPSSAKGVCGKRQWQMIELIEQVTSDEEMIVAVLGLNLTRSFRDDGRRE